MTTQLPEGWFTGPAGMIPGQGEVGTVDTPFYIPGTGPATYLAGEGQDQTIGSLGPESIPQDVAWKQIAPNKYQTQHFDDTGLVGEPLDVDLTDPNEWIAQLIIGAGMAAVGGLGATNLGAMVAPSLSQGAQLAIGQGLFGAGKTYGMGGNLSDMAKAGLLSGATSYAGSTIGDMLPKGGLTPTGIPTVDAAISKGITGAATGAAGAALQGKGLGDIGQAAIQSGLGAGLSSGANSLVGSALGQSGLSTTAMNILGPGTVAALMGKDPTGAMLRAAVDQLTGAVKSSIPSTKVDATSANGTVSAAGGLPETVARTAPGVSELTTSGATPAELTSDIQRSTADVTMPGLDTLNVATPATDALATNVPAALSGTEGAPPNTGLPSSVSQLSDSAKQTILLDKLKALDKQDKDNGVTLSSAEKDKQISDAISADPILSKLFPNAVSNLNASATGNTAAGSAADDVTTVAGGLPSNQVRVEKNYNTEGWTVNPQTGEKEFRVVIPGVSSDQPLIGTLSADGKSVTLPDGTVRALSEGDSAAAQAQAYSALLGIGESANPPSTGGQAIVGNGSGSSGGLNFPGFTPVSTDTGRGGDGGDRGFSLLALSNGALPALDLSKVVYTEPGLKTLATNALVNTAAQTNADNAATAVDKIIADKAAADKAAADKAAAEKAAADKAARSEDQTS